MTIKYELMENGFASLEPIDTKYGKLKVYESSNADEPSIWLSISEPRFQDGNGPDDGYQVELTFDDVEALRERLAWLEMHHYQIGMRPEDIPDEYTRGMDIHLLVEMLRMLDREATPAPWIDGEPCKGPMMNETVTFCAGVVAPREWPEGMTRAKEDCKIIVEGRTALPVLLRYIKYLEDGIQQARNALSGKNSLNGYTILDDLLSGKHEKEKNDVGVE